MNQQEQASQDSIADRTEHRLLEIDGTTLTPLVRNALECATIEVIDWEHQVLRGGAGLGGSVYRLTGTGREGDQVVPWSLILKVICDPAYTDDARAVFDRADPSAPFYWKREPLAYRSGALQDLPGGLCAPRCFEVIEHPEAFWLWLEEVEDDFEGQWPLEHYGVVARHLGQLNGAYLAGRPLPSGPWVSQGFIRAYVEQAAPVYARLRTSLDHRLIRRMLQGNDPARLFDPWEERETYLVAAVSVWSLRTLGGARANVEGTLAFRRLWSDLREGVVYLSRQPGLLTPLALTFATLVAISPSGGLLAAIVHSQEGTIVDLGLLGAAFSVGAFLGAGYAGARSAGRSPVRRYALLALLAAAALALFALLPIGLHSALPLAVLGFIAFAEAVWNTSRVRQLAEPAFQARVQSFTSMAFTLSFPLGSLWGGLAIDRFGVQALLGGTAVLALVAVVAMLAARGPAAAKHSLEDAS